MLRLQEHLRNSPTCPRSHCKPIRSVTSGAPAVALWGPRSLTLPFSLEGKVRWDLTTGGQGVPRRPLCCSCCCCWWRTCRSGWVLSSQRHGDPGALPACWVLLAWPCLGRVAMKAGAPPGTLEDNHTPRKSSGQAPVPPTPPSLPRLHRAPAAGQTARPVSARLLVSSILPSPSSCSAPNSAPSHGTAEPRRAWSEGPRVGIIAS